MKIPYRPVTRLRELAKEVELDLSYVYEELAFVTHNPFLFKMGKQGKDLAVYFNVELEKDQLEILESKLKQKSDSIGFDLSFPGKFRLTGGDDNTISVEYL